MVSRRHKSRQHSLSCLCCCRYLWKPLSNMAVIRDFKINVPQEKLDRLKRQLDDYQWPRELENAGWDYGSPL